MLWAILISPQNIATNSPVPKQRIPKRRFLNKAFSEDAANLASAQQNKYIGQIF